MPMKVHWAGQVRLPLSQGKTRFLHLSGHLVKAQPGGTSALAWSTQMTMRRTDMAKGIFLWNTLDSQGLESSPLSGGSHSRVLSWPGPCPSPPS